MKRLFLCLLFVIIVANSISLAQIERITLVSGKVAQLTRYTSSPDYADDWKIYKMIKDESDTIIYFSYSFLNQQYKYISDYGSIIFKEKNELKEFIDNLRIFANKEQNINYEKGIMSLYEFSNKIYISDDKNKEKYTIITKKQALKLADVLEQNIHYMK